MDITANWKPRTIAELNEILPKEINLTAKKKPHPPKVPKDCSATATPSWPKPMNFAHIMSSIKASLSKNVSPERCVRTAKSATGRWNSSVKVDKRQTYKPPGKPSNPVRKTLDFKAKPKVKNSKASMYFETPKFPKPCVPLKKTIPKKTNNTVRVSGICDIPESPEDNSKPGKSTLMLTTEKNTEVVLPKLIPQYNRKSIKPPPVPGTTLANSCYKSSCDDSFLQNEKKINDYEQNTVGVKKTKDPTPRVSTPFNQNGNVEEYFDNSFNSDDSAAYNDNTIMSFNNPSNRNESNEKEKSHLNKTTTTKIGATSILDELTQKEKEIQEDIKMKKYFMNMLNKHYQTNIENLKYIRKLKKEVTTLGNHGKTAPETKDDCEVAKTEETIPTNSLINSKTCSVNESCSKNNVVIKSVPYQMNKFQSNIVMSEEASNVYMEIKQRLNFLNTPLKHTQVMAEPDTPAVTSYNVQVQLERLFNDHKA